MNYIHNYSLNGGFHVDAHLTRSEHPEATIDVVEPPAMAHLMAPPHYSAAVEVGIVAGMAWMAFPAKTNTGCTGVPLANYHSHGK